MSVWTNIKEFFTVESPEVQRQQLDRLAAIIDRHIATTWPEVGAALTEIHSRQLYRITHQTWPAFLKDRWDMSEAHANRVMGAAKLHQKALAAGQVSPTTPRLVRPLLALKEPEQLDAWSDAVDLAAGDPVRPEHVAAAVSKRQTSSKKKPAKRPKPLRLRLPSGILIMEPGRGWTSPQQMLSEALQHLAAKNAA